MGGNDIPPSSITEEEFQKALNEEQERYAPYWKKVIAIYADNG
jgi:tripartite-type tricarboxylate transporter receptor subunit TctC